MSSQSEAHSPSDRGRTSIVDVNDVIRSIVQIMGREITSRISLVERLCLESTAVRIGRSQLEQVVTELVLNARDAIQAAGSILIQTRAGVDSIQLIVSDTGVGMSEATKRRVFEPYFTTRAELGGGGIGMSTVGAILSNAGGSIHVESSPGQGTTFTVTLPASSARKVDS